jgi:5-methyltetrahydrofolate--homocysteine methyltransferase
MDRDFFKQLNSGPVLFDGGFGTQLQKEGLPVGVVPEQWNLLKPDIIEKIHRDYIHAGAMVLTTNSFGGSPYKLKNAGLELECYSLNKAAASLARRAAGPSAFVAGSIGPTGALLLMGDISPEDMITGFEMQVEGLVEGGADVIIVETMSDLDEALNALKAVRNVAELPVIVSMTFEPGQNGFRTMMGVDVSTAAKTLELAGADIIGTNCGIGIDNAIEIITIMRQNTRLPILAEPNAGLPHIVDGRTVYAETPEGMAEKLTDLISAGAQLVGGCCGTTPEHIQAFRKKLH